MFTNEATSVGFHAYPLPWLKRDENQRALKQDNKQQQTTHMWHQARIIGNIGGELAKY